MVLTGRTLGFIGFGEVGSTLSRGLREKNPDLSIAAFDVAWSDMRRKEAESLGVQLVASPQELAEKSTLILCAVVPQASKRAAEQIAPWLGPNHLYADLTSSGPAKAKEIEPVVSHNGARFAKVALMGAVAVFGFRVPGVASGPGARAIGEYLCSLGMDIEVLNDDPAAAATLKLCRSLFMKGIVGLAVETLRVARANGIEREVVASLAETWDKEGFAPALNRLVCSSVTHANRRAAELDEAIDSFGEWGLELPVAQACRGVFNDLMVLQAGERFRAAPPKEMSAVLDALRESGV